MKVDIIQDEVAVKKRILEIQLTRVINFLLEGVEEFANGWQKDMGCASKFLTTRQIKCLKSLGLKICLIKNKITIVNHKNKDFDIQIIVINKRNQKLEKTIYLMKVFKKEAATLAS